MSEKLLSFITKIASGENSLGYHLENDAKHLEAEDIEEVDDVPTTLNARLSLSVVVVASNLSSTKNLARLLKSLALGLMIPWNASS